MRLLDLPASSQEMQEMQEMLEELPDLLQAFPRLNDVVDDVFGGLPAVNALPNTDTVQAVTLSSTPTTLRQAAEEAVSEQAPAIASSEPAQGRLGSEPVAAATATAVAQPTLSTTAVTTVNAPKKRPVLDRVTGSGTSKTPVRDVIKNTGQQLRDTVGEVRTAVEDVTGVKSPVRGANQADTAADGSSGSSAGSSGDSATD